LCQEVFPNDSKPHTIEDIYMGTCTCAHTHTHTHTCTNFFTHF
jgi:hypothetical protein